MGSELKPVNPEIGMAIMVLCLAVPGTAVLIVPFPPLRVCLYVVFVHKLYAVQDEVRPSDSTVQYRQSGRNPYQFLLASFDL